MVCFFTYWVLSNVRICDWFTKNCHSVILSSCPKHELSGFFQKAFASTPFSSRASPTQIHSNKLVFQAWLTHVARQQSGMPMHDGGLLAMARRWGRGAVFILVVFSEDDFPSSRLSCRLLEKGAMCCFAPDFSRLSMLRKTRLCYLSKYNGVYYILFNYILSDDSCIMKLYLFNLLAKV